MNDNNYKQDIRDAFLDVHNIILDTVLLVLKKVICKIPFAAWFPFCSDKEIDKKEVQPWFWETWNKMPPNEREKYFKNETKSFEPNYQNSEEVVGKELQNISSFSELKERFTSENLFYKLFESERNMNRKEFNEEFDKQYRENINMENFFNKVFEHSILNADEQIIRDKDKYLINVCPGYAPGYVCKISTSGTKFLCKCEKVDEAKVDEATDDMITIAIKAGGDQNSAKKWDNLGDVQKLVKEYGYFLSYNNDSYWCSAASAASAVPGASALGGERAVVAACGKYKYDVKPVVQSEGLLGTYYDSEWKNKAQNKGNTLPPFLNIRITKIVIDMRIYRPIRRSWKLY